MITGRGGMGSHKHGVSGTVGQNRRALQALSREVNRKMAAVKKKPKAPMYGSVQELMKREKKR